MRHLFHMPHNHHSSNHPFTYAPIYALLAHVNTHAMQTRAKYGIFKPKVYAASKELASVAKALQQENWRVAMCDEYMALVRNGTCSLVSLPTRRQPIGYKWVFKVKENPNGSVHKYKAHLVAKGFNQIAGFDYNDTFNLVVKPTTI